MTHIALLSLVLLSSLLSWTAAESSILCNRTKVLTNAEVHYSFLRSDPRQASPSLRLYHSAWSGDRALLRCAISDDAAVIQNYFSACRERTQEFSHHPDENIDVESMLKAEERCFSVASPGVGERRKGSTRRRPVRSDGGDTAAENHQDQAERSGARAHQRIRRNIILPGTLWCGSGNLSTSSGELGYFADTDNCCREHDHCNHTIPSKQTQFGVFNNNFFTMSHCDCDNKFHSCLTQANDSICDTVGHTFFNLLKMHCFEFSHKPPCTENNGSGMCNETEMAVVHLPTTYTTPNRTEISVNTSVVNTTVPEGGDTSLDPKEEQLSCAVYKDLDGCRYKILPQQKKYGLYNRETRTLYHCNCTSSVFQTISEQLQLSEVETILLRLFFVSQSCFLPQDCTAGKMTAVLMSAELPQGDHRSSFIYRPSR